MRGRPVPGSPPTRSASKQIEKGDFGQQPIKVHSPFLHRLVAARRLRGTGSSHQVFLNAAAAPPGSRAARMENDMPTMAAIDNPLGKFRDGAVASADGREWPIPLTATRIDVTIRGGLAIVTTERIFRNGEARRIEATMTFPVPVDATLCALSARIDGRLLDALAQPRATARSTYERAIDQGRATVLHEELLKGVHMLSVGQVRPGAEIAVTTSWTAPLSFVADSARLRIPTTVGDIYGRSPLSSSDDLVADTRIQEATVGIVCEDGVATLLDAGAAKDGRHSVTLDHPIDIAVAGWAPQALRGVAADGRAVELAIAPVALASDPLDVDVLFDHSGSMSERASGNPEFKGSKFEFAKAGLLAVARDRLQAGDRMQLWEFNDGVERVGAATGTGIEALVQKLQEPTGGTEIGRAFDAAVAKSKARNIVIITDGKSWAFDPQKIARAGVRVTAVLIGEDSLEGGVADLAGMTGGQVFVAAGSDTGGAIAAALGAARAPHRPAPPIEGDLARVEAFRRGSRLVATWGAQATGAPSPEARLIGATAAMLAIPLLPPDAAAELAAREGIVCHLTSLVLVDEAGTRHEGIPATRKVELSMPRTTAPRAAMLCAEPLDHFAATAACRADPAPERSSGPPARARVKGLLARMGSDLIGRGIRPDDGTSIVPSSSPRLDLSRALDQIDWDADPDALRRGELGLLPPPVAALLQQAAKLPAIDALAWSAGLDPLVAVIALLARAAAKSSRAADRLARNLLHNVDAGAVARAMEALGLPSFSPAP